MSHRKYHGDQARYVNVTKAARKRLKRAKRMAKVGGIFVPKPLCTKTLRRVVVWDAELGGWILPRRLIVRIDVPTLEVTSDDMAHHE